MDIWYADLPMIRNSCIQGGKRPVVIVSNNTCNEVSPIITVVPLTRQKKKLSQPTHAVIRDPGGDISVALGEQIMTIDRNLLDDWVGKVKNSDCEQIENAIIVQLGLSGKGDS
jgi:mRNA interferase MazF